TRLKWHQSKRKRNAGFVTDSFDFWLLWLHVVVLLALSQGCAAGSPSWQHGFQDSKPSAPGSNRSQRLSIQLFSNSKKDVFL
ncbi:hypothetical protein Nmel_007218, partial [Mimus melanotis]